MYNKLNSIDKFALVTVNVCKPRVYTVMFCFFFFVVFFSAIIFIFALASLESFSESLGLIHHPKELTEKYMWTELCNPNKTVALPIYFLAA